MKKKTGDQKTKRESADNRFAASPAETRAAKNSGSGTPLSEKFSYLLLAGVALLALVCRIQLLTLPLERDEGEYAYVGQQLLHGVPPFISIYHVKLPGIYAAYALIEALFGQTCSGIHLGLLFANLGVALVIFFMIRKRFNTHIACYTTAAFLLLTLSKVLLGFAANAEHFVLLFAMPGILVLLYAFDRQESGNKIMSALFFLLSGLLLGISYLMKQHGVFFIFFSGLLFLYQFFTRKPRAWGQAIINGGLFAAGIVIPLACTCLIFLKLGLFDKFWWWTWQYPRIYITQTPFVESLETLKFVLFTNRISYGFLAVFWALLVLALFGLTGVLFQKNIGQKVFVWGLTAFSLAAVCTGFTFYPHYFILIAPAIGLSSALGANAISTLFIRFKIPAGAKYGGLIAISAVFAVAIYCEREYLFENNQLWIMRSCYGDNPFPEAVVIGEYIKAHTKPEDKIVVFGSEPEIYFYAGRRAATGFIYIYEMMREHPFAHQFQMQMIDEVKQSKPAYLVWVKLQLSWFAAPVNRYDDTIVKWSAQYAEQYYRQAGVTTLNLPGDLEQEICWDTPGNPCQVKSSAFISIYRRKDGI